MAFPRAFRHLAPEPDAPALARAAARTAATSADRSLRAMLRELAASTGGPVDASPTDAVVVDLAERRILDLRDAPAPAPAVRAAPRRTRRPLI